MSETLLLRMTKEMKKALKSEAERRQLSLSALIRQILLSHLEGKGAAQ
jgi:predicted HicB family RNase H-like nuclease